MGERGVMTTKIGKAFSRWYEEESLGKGYMCHQAFSRAFPLENWTVVCLLMLCPKPFLSKLLSVSRRLDICKLHFQDSPCSKLLVSCS